MERIYMKILYGLVALFILVWIISKVMNTPSNDISIDNKTVIEKPLEIDKTLKVSKAPATNEDCMDARNQFAACDKYSGNLYIDCVAQVKAPPGCGPVSLK